MNENDLPTVHTAFDMKSITVLTGIDIAGQLAAIGDEAGASALILFVQMIEKIPCSANPLGVIAPIDPT